MIKLINMPAKWVVEKKIKINGRRVRAWVPNPRIPREMALKRFKELTEEIAKRTRKTAS